MIHRRLIAPIIRILLQLLRMMAVHRITLELVNDVR